MSLPGIERMTKWTSKLMGYAKGLFLKSNVCLIGLKVIVYKEVLSIDYCSSGSIFRLKLAADEVIKYTHAFQ